jgi:ribosomal protein S18 acetylase RimI-like enzyme
MVEIRRVGAADLDDLTSLLARCAAELNGLRGGQALLDQVVGSWLDGPLLLERDASTATSVTVATVRGVVGFCVAHLDGTDGWIGLYVDSDQRRQGVGGKLLSHAMSDLESKGARVIDAVATPGDRALKSLFEVHGFKARLLVMRAQT